MEKLTMDEYGAIVWAAYGVAFVVLAGVSWLSMRDWRKAKAQLHHLSSARDEA